MVSRVPTAKTRAAVAWKARSAAGSHRRRELDGPRWRGADRDQATGVCHRRVHALGADPEGLFPVIFGHEGAGVVVDVGPGVRSLKGDHVIPLYTPECRQCKAAPRARPTSAPRSARRRGPGVMPDGTSRFSIGGKKVHHYMGCSHVLELHRAARDRGGEDPRGRAVRQGLLHRLRRHHRHRRGDQHRRRSSRARTSSCSASAASA